MEHPTPDPALVRARAAARLRAHPTLTGAEARAVRAARAELGASLRRTRAALPPATPITAPVTFRQPRRRRSRLAASAGLLVLALAALAVLPSQHPATDAAAGAAAAEPLTLAAAVPEAVLSRGRSHGVPPPVAVAAATPEPIIATAPPAAPVAAAKPAAAAPVGQGGQGGNGRGASPAPSASPAPTPRPTPAPTASPAPTPSPVPTQAPRAANMTRFTGRVTDARTGRPVSGACVIVGVRACGDRDAYTDAAGRFTIDLPVGSSWDVNFGRSGYLAAYRRLVSSAARTVDIGTVRITPLP